MLATLCTFHKLYGLLKSEELQNKNKKQRQGHNGSFWGHKLQKYDYFWGHKLPEYGYFWGHKLPKRPTDPISKVR